MFVRSKKWILFAVALLLVPVAYQNCANYQENSPFESLDTPDEPLPLGTVRIDGPSGGSGNVEDSYVSINGTCNTGKTEHYIEVRAYSTASGTQVPAKLTEKGSCASGSGPECYVVKKHYSPTGAGRDIKCDHQTYFTIVPITCNMYTVGGAAGMFTFHVQLVTIENGVEKRDNNKKVFYQIPIYWNEAGIAYCT